MSAGSSLVIHRDLSECAPLFEASVTKALAECNANHMDAFVYEALRTEELQSLYWSRGRTRLANGVWQISDPSSIVTHVQHANYGWHFFGLAVDVISKSMEWNVPEEWHVEVARIFKRYGLHWGGDWHGFRDLPHFQWNQQYNPSDNDRNTYRIGGLEAVWDLNNALGDK